MSAHEELDDALGRLRSLIAESSFGEAVAQQLSGRTPEQDVAETVRRADDTVSSPKPGSVHPPKRGFWGQLTESEQGALLAIAKEVVYPIGTILWSEGQTADQAVVIQSGSIRVSVNRDGHERIIAFRGPGDIVGERAALLLRRRSATIVAMGTVRGLRMTTQQFAVYLSDHPRVVAVLEREVYDRLTEPAQPGPSSLAPAHDQVPYATAPMPCAQQTGRVQHGGQAQLVPTPSALFEDEPTQRMVISPRGPTGPSWTGQNCTIVYTDIVGFSQSHRNDRDRLNMRRALYALLREAFEESGVPWDACHIEDRGDGALIVVPPEVPTAAVVDLMIASLVVRLRKHNERSSGAVRIQLRVAVHVGPVIPDPPGVSGWALVRAARLLDARPLKDRLAATGADLGFIASNFVYESVIAHSPGYVNPAEYEPVNFTVKKLKTGGWIRLSGVAAKSSPRNRLHAYGYQLSDREAEVVGMATFGLDIGQIADQLGISPWAVRDCMRTARDKLDQPSATALTRALLDERLALGT